MTYRVFPLLVLLKNRKNLHLSLRLRYSVYNQLQNIQPSESELIYFPLFLSFWCLTVNWNSVHQNNVLHNSGLEPHNSTTVVQYSVMQSVHINVTMSHIVNECPLMKHSGGLQALHTVDKDLITWLCKFSIC